MKRKLLLAGLACLVLAAVAVPAARAQKPFETVRPQEYSLSPQDVTCALGVTSTLCIPVDNTFNTVQFSGNMACNGPANSSDLCSRNDDDSRLALALGFTFHFYGQDYNTVYINNNGNITFDGPYCQFTSTGFPVSGFPMIAPFWADVDTRGGASGVVHYRLDAHKLVVVWDHVGFYSGHTQLLSTFELILSDGTDAALPNGDNVCFCYGDMQWTTGDASGGSGGFGGVAATVGANAGNGTAFFQIGRFDQPGTAYDGAGGANDGVDYLDGQHICFYTGELTNQPPIGQGFPPGYADTLCVGETYRLSTSFSSPELGQTTTTTVDLMGLANATANSTPGNLSTQEIVFTPSAAQVGPHTIRYVAVDDGVPVGTTIVDLVLEVVSPCDHCLPANVAPAFSGGTVACGASIPGVVGAPLAFTLAAVDADAADVVTLSATGLPAGAILTPPLPASGNPASSAFQWTPTSADVGVHTLSFTAADGCASTPCELTITVTEADSCPLSQGYWKNHGAQWPASALSLMLGSNSYTQQQLLAILTTPPQGGNALLILAHQLIAAKVNVEAHSSLPPIAPWIRQADSLVAGLAIPGSFVQASSPLGAAMTATAGILDQYNNAALTPGCVPRIHAGRRAEPAQPVAPAGLSLSSAPNPFRDGTTIQFSLPFAADVRLTVYDPAGRTVRVIANEHLESGTFTRSWDGRDADGARVHRGVYFYRLSAGQFTLARTLMLR